MDKNLMIISYDTIQNKKEMLHDPFVVVTYRFGNNYDYIAYSSLNSCVKIANI